MVKRKTISGDDLDGDQTIPLPIQSFFWRQTRPFIRPKLEKLCEASCVSFERVVVQNILHGCSPSLCAAIQSVPRWKVIQAAFPHVMHACSTLLTSCKRLDIDARFGSNETKLLYILHWIILDAASECEDQESDPLRNGGRTLGNSGSSEQMHSLSTIQLFVYLFAPLLDYMDDTDFQTLKLENGLRLWQPLWDYRQPDIPCFATPVKPQRNVLKAQRSLLKINTNAGYVYMGKGTSRENLNVGCMERSIECEDENNLSCKTSTGEYQSPRAPIVTMSNICPSSTGDSQSANIEVICEHCNTVMSMRGAGDGSRRCSCGRRESSTSYDKMNPCHNRLPSLIDHDFVKQRLVSAVNSGVKGPTTPDILSASYFDVAVLRCLFCQYWSEDGIYWALRYIQQRLMEVCDEVFRRTNTDRARSRSLPFSDIKVLKNGSLPYNPFETHRFSDKRGSSAKGFSKLTSKLTTIRSGTEIDKLSPDRPTHLSAFEELRNRETKRLRLGGGRRHIDTGTAQINPTKPTRLSPVGAPPVKHGVQFATSKSPGISTPTSSFTHGSKDDSSSAGTMSTGEGDGDTDRASKSQHSSTSGKTVKFPLSLSGITSFDSDRNKGNRNTYTKTKLHPLGFDKDSATDSSSHESSTSSQQGESTTNDLGQKKFDTMPKPIITVTEHSYDFDGKKEPISPKGSMNGGSTEIDDDGKKKSGISRSMTDSDISYRQEDEVHEVPGSVHYIQDNGHINYKVILQAVHFISNTQTSDRICEVLLNVMNWLLDLDIIEQPRDSQPKTPTTPASEGDRPQEAEEKEGSPSQARTCTETEGQGGDSTAHSLAMDTLLSIFKALGCPHGCGDGVRGSHGDLLRLKGQNCLQRLQRVNAVLFRSYLKDTIKKSPLQDSVDFLHAFLGFCVEPCLILQQSERAERSASGSQGGSKKSSCQESQQNGFQNNFGHTIGGVGYRGVEGVIIASIFKSFVSRCVENSRDLYGSDNIGLFCDVRQFMAYVKEIHGGTFRRVGLGGLLDSHQALKQKEKKQQDKLKQSLPIRRTTSQTSESGDERETRRSISTASEESGKTRKSLFKKKLKKVTSSLALQQYAAASDSELLDESHNTKHNSQSPTTEDDSIASNSTGRRRFSKFHLGWRRAAKSDHEEEALSDPPPLDRRESRSELQFNRVGGKGKMSFKTASHATVTFLSARKRIEGGLKSLGKRMSKRGSVDNWKTHQSTTADDAESESTLTKEKKLVDRFLVKSGMLRFSFLLECCHPGSIPDPTLVSAMLELDAPVIARASLLLECAHFIHRCNHGDWPNWMHLNLPSFRHSASALQNRGQPSGYRRTLTLQKAAGRMFYAWAENLGTMLQYILSKEYASKLDVIGDVRSEARKRELRTMDDEEDFLDEATVNDSGSSCPYALKMIACLVLQEITTFLRETFRDLPKSRSPRREGGCWERNLTTRRWSSIVSSPGHSPGSESNMADIPHSSSGVAVGSPGVGERKISFAVLGHADRSDSLHSSTTSISVLDPTMSPHIPGDERKGRRLAQGRQKLLRYNRRGSTQNTSFRHNRSFRLMRQAEGSIKRIGSVKGRKVSSQSLQSGGERFPEEDGVDDMESVLSDEPESGPEYQEADDYSLCQNMPWIKVVVQLANLSNFICPHQSYCHPNCYERQRRSCSRLVTAMRKVYLSTEHDPETLDKSKQGLHADFLKERLKRRESIFQQSSPTKRRESTPLLEKIKTDVSMSKLKMNSTTVKKEEKPKEVKEDTAIMKYITSQVQKLTQCPMGILAKAAPILTEDNLIDILPVAWELMLETDQELAAAAASVFLLSSVKTPDKAHALITKELQHEDTCQRINAVLRFGVLWKFRHQVWPRMEDGGNMFFKLPPPNIDFTLPSPTIGLPTQTVVDPPWTPHFKAKIEEVTVNQEGTKSLVTATTTRRKEQQEMIRKALQAEEERKRVGRENFPMTTVSITQLAAYEPALHHAGEEHEEESTNQSTSWRNGSVHWARFLLAGEEDRTEHTHHMQLAQTFFPSCICATALPILHLLDDQDVNADGISVAEVAEKVIWTCIVEDPILFLRHFLEKLTHKDKQEELLYLLRRMVLYFQDLPAQMAHSLYNYLTGYVMFYVRSPCSGSQEAIAGALGLIWQVIPSVDDLYFKDLKQTLKKEQCDPYIMISANVPSAKKIIIHGTDQTGIPSQLPIHEDTQFSQILQESLDFFNVPEDEYSSYFLVDTKSNQIHNLNAYVRDFYFFRRNVYPQLSLVKMNPDHAFQSLEKQAFILKFVEIGKVLFTHSVLKSTAPHQMQNHVSFLHEEFLKQPSFPRKALEAEFGLYHGKSGEELYGLDTLHKLSWVKLMSAIFSKMTSTFSWTNDLQLFLNVINGCMILHCEDTALLRFCLSTLINTCRHFKHIFSMNGFLYLMPTLLKIYSNNQPNPVLCQAVEYVCKQFYILHRKPFILQMFGSVTPLLDMTSEDTGLVDCRKVQPDCLFKLLLSLERDTVDSLCILELIQGEKPLRALDFCYENDPDRLEMIEVINMCVTVIGYAPDSFRSVQMLTVLEVVVTRYLEHLRLETTRQDNPPAARAEITIITNMGISIRALLSCCEYFTRGLGGEGFDSLQTYIDVSSLRDLRGLTTNFFRNMSLPQRQLESDKPNVKSNQSNHSPLGGTSYYDDREDSHASCRHMEEGRKKAYTQDSEDMEMRTEFRKPRDSLLSVVAEFYASCQSRLKELRKMLQDPSFRPPELLDHKTHNRLAEIANTLLKLAPYDPDTLRCTGLQRYMTEILPITDWKQEAIRPGLNLILRRLDRLFIKISKKTALRRQADWDAAANLLKGVFLTLKKFQYIAHLPHLKDNPSDRTQSLLSNILQTLIGAVLSIILSGPGGAVLPDNLFSFHGSHRIEHITQSILTPPSFSSAVVKLVAMQMAALGEQFSLEQICGGMAEFPTPERYINILVNFILPLCVRLGCGRKDTPKMNTEDVKFALQVSLNVLCPPIKIRSQQQGNTKSTTLHHLSISENHRCSSYGQLDKGFKHENEMLLHTAYLGLEILMTCFDKVLSTEWHKVTHCIQNLGCKSKVSLPMWKFLDFVVTYRPSIFLLLQPFIRYKIMRINCDTAQEYYIQQTIKDKMLGYSFTHPKCNASILLQLAVELQALKDEFHTVGAGEFRSASATDTTERSDMPLTQIPEQRRQASITDIAVEIINPVSKPTLATIGKKASRATIFSQSSSSTGAPFKTTVVTSSLDSTSPVLSERKVSRRISAKDGSNILEKFRRPTMDDISPGDTIVMSEATKIQRQPNIVLRSPGASKQNSLDEQGSVLYESDEGDTPNGGGSILSGHFGGVTSPDLDPRSHRFQRQDIKSRKTFKRKKTKTSSKGHYASKNGCDKSDNSPRGSPTRRPAYHGSPTHRYHATSPQKLHRSPPNRSYAFLQQNAEAELKNLRQVRSTLVGASSPSAARSVEMIPESVEMKPSRPRYIQRSKSHDDPHGDFHAPGTARGRIARQGARIVRSRSPSCSPVRVGQSPTASPTRNQAYISQYDSSDSLNANESSALLKDDDSLSSPQSMCIYFDERGRTRDTVM
ncbi:protein unc-80 homolog isoform X3 [Mizuhopecten yessoensis]|uniref:protein unc-80 homolog isoform X3 n=1 Tax=Mizuhopecten yessoensis TaxID=6573 RepID=UPI000B45A5B3|nr:protein unc-80 homolog isoform X3 [Mizuhopecten yessoensis]